MINDKSVDSSRELDTPPSFATTGLFDKHGFTVMEIPELGSMEILSGLLSLSELSFLRCTSLHFLSIWLSGKTYSKIFLSVVCLHGLVWEEISVSIMDLPENLVPTLCNPSQSIVLMSAASVLSSIFLLFFSRPTPIGGREIHIGWIREEGGGGRRRRDEDP